MIHTIRLLCIAVFLACLIAVFFMALYFAEHKDKDYWRVQAENMAEYSQWQASEISRLEKENNKLLTEGE